MHPQRMATVATGERNGGAIWFVGAPSGYFLLPPVDRLWIPEERQKATIFPAEVTLAINNEITEYCPKDLPYVIRTAGKESK